ncbi:MAG: DegT/DnrJ/EryC1/StrS family aminotransferase [Candidatus Nomurabacteria bacterium]|jgi:dTDP-4-amino-4,6-dideoxygalactose transaminase|nr:DegT/DnrJ/EryC1/StrS family aminotransferase [Candidatus Nomurabacteria bacterium]
MKIIQSTEKICHKLASLTNTQPENWHLCMKARYGMATIFESIAKAEGKGEVITTPYTCSTAVNPILVSQLTPIYADLDLSNLSIINPEKLINKSTRAIIMQHTLGIIGQKSPLKTLAAKHKLILIEDSAHCLCRLALDSKRQPLADISIHSFGVEKVLSSTKFGAAIYINPKLKTTHPALYDKIITEFTQLKSPNFPTDLRLHLYRPTNAILQRLPKTIKKPLRNLAITTKILEPPISPAEQSGKQHSPLDTNEFINSKILEALPSLPKNYRTRLDITNHYIVKLKSATNLQLLSTISEPLLAFPILLPTPEKADSLYEALTASGFFIRRWYSPLFFPGVKNRRTYKYNPKTCPIAEITHPRVLCLPTDISKTQANQIIAIINPLAKS